MKKKRLTIIHFQPIELYPPAMNFLDIIAKENNLFATVHTNFPSIAIKSVSFRSLALKRWGTLGDGLSFLSRWRTYLKFNIGVLICLLIDRPLEVLYYESYSAFPAVIYCFLFPKTKLYIHYHEYHEPKWYSQGMATVKWFHWLEKRIGYNRAIWISETNADRLSMFLADNRLTFDPNRHFVFPNYPPKSWKPVSVKKEASSVTRLVYVGSFGSMQTLYIKELLQWVKDRPGQLSLDVYSFNTSPAIEAWVRELGAENIRLLPPLAYFQLPGVLPHYDIGLIIYKGADKNFIYNAPNKLFEYLACGLDVWYPSPMAGCYAYDEPAYHPRVTRLDFENLEGLDVAVLTQKNEAMQRTISFTCEDASGPLLQQLTA